MDEQNEIWKEINGFENYHVSNMGNIKNIATHKDITKYIKNNYEYVGLIITRTNIVHKRVHILVANTFLINDDPKNKIYVNHKDGNKINNKLNNLEYITPSDNVKHAFEMGLIKKRQSNALVEQKNFPKDVKQCVLTRIKKYSDYSATEDGNIYSHKSNKFLCATDIDGYDRVYVINDTKRYGELVHRLIAQTFIPNPENKSQVNHKNGNRKDNRVENLEWVIQSENINHAKMMKRLRKQTENEIK